MTGVDKPGAVCLENVGYAYASPVARGGRVYVTDLEGNTIVMSHDDRPEVVVLNSRDDEFAASAAIVGRELFLRGKKHLYCIAADTAQDRSTTGAVQPQLNALRAELMLNGSVEAACFNFSLSGLEYTRKGMHKGYMLLKQKNRMSLGWTHCFLDSIRTARYIDRSTS